MKVANTMPHPIRVYVAINPDEFAMFFAPESIEHLVALGRIDFASEAGVVSVPTNIADTHDVLVTSWCTESFDPQRLIGSRLRLGVHSAGSVRRLFPKSALENGLQVVQAGSEAMAPPVAELALTLTLALLRNLHLHDRGLQTTHDWQAGGAGLLGHSIQDQRIGVVGLSRTGRSYVSMLQGMGAAQIVAYDPYVSVDDAERMKVPLVGLAELCRTSDVLAVHAPDIPETHHLIGATELASMKDGAILINTARSALVDQDAMTRELVAGRIRAGLDVFDDEPLPSDSPLYGLPNVLLTPHIAGGTVESRHVQGETVVKEIERFLAGRDLQHEVHLENYDHLS